MNLYEYQKLARGTALPGALSLDYLIPGLAGEVGEAVEAATQSEPISLKEELASELADINWFFAMICNVLRWDFFEVAFWGNKEATLESNQLLIDEYFESHGEELSIQEHLDNLQVCVGNVCSAWAKSVRDNKRIISPEKADQIKENMADAFWVNGLLAHKTGNTVEDLLKKNIEKLYGRKERGVLGGSGNNR